jgi:hypothetical protein
VSDFRLKVIAETQAAESSLKQVDKVATEATRARNLKIEIPNYSDLSKNFRDLNKDIGSAANGIKDFYKVASKLPVGPINDINELAGQLKRVAVTATDTSRNVGDAGDVIKATFNATNRAAETLVSRLTKIALGLYVIKEAAGLVQGAFGGMFNETIGREIKLRETILKAQTTLASTNKVFKDGKEITDPYQKIVTLTGAVRTNIDSIRERSIALAGVTSGEVIEVFGIVASQIGQIGGGLKEAEDLAITFAAALGTFGIPLYQARQEIGSILRGDITVDSYLATALGIRSQDIAKAKTEAGGVVKFLEERLGAAVAGQRIAAEGFSGVVSNIKDLSELVNQNFGAGLLDPLLEGLTKTFNFLFSIREQVFAISRLAGQSIGAVLSVGAGMTTGASAVSKDPTAKISGALAATESGIKAISLKITAAIQGVYLQMATLAARASAAFAVVTKGLATLAYGLLSIKLEAFKALISVVESLSPALLVAANAVGGLLAAWGGFMQIPIVQFIAQISAGMRVLEATGITGLISSLLVLRGVITWVQANIPKIIAQFNSIRAIIGGFIAAIGTLVVNTTRAGAAMLAAWQPQSRALQALKVELTQISTQLGILGSNAQAAGQRLGGLRNTGGQLGGGIVSLIAGMVKFQLIMLAITTTISFVTNLFGKWKESQDRLASEKRAEEALKRLNTTYKDVGEAASAATKRAKEFEQAIVNTQYEAAFANLKKLEAELKGINELLDRKNKTTVFDDLKAGTEALIANLGKVWGLMQLIAGAKSPKDVKPDDNKIFGFDTRNLTNEGRREVLLEEEKKARAEVNKWASADELKGREENVKLIAQKQIDLSKEYAELQRQQQNDLFQQRQTLAQKEVEIFRAAGELRIFQMEQANAKLIEGEEGASRAALEALNTYLSVRENGELEIEAAKKDIVIEVANLEKTIADYRFENEKKIAEIRKRAGENEKAMADARRQAEGQPPAGAVPTGAAGPLSQLIGGVESYGGNYGAFNRGGSNQGRTAHGSGIDPNLTNMTIAEIQRRQLAPGVPANQQLHATGKYQIIGGTLRGLMSGSYGETGVKPTDKYSPENQEKLFAALARNRIVPGNEAATMRGLRQEWVGLQNVSDAKLRPATQALMTGGAASSAAATPTPALQSLDVAAPSLAKYEEAVQGLAGAMERARRLSEALTNARTVAAFDAIAQAAFPRVALEGYQDSLAEAQLTYEAIAFSSADAFNPERTALATQATVQITRSVTELGQIQAEISKRENLSAAEKKKFIEQTTKAQADYVAGVREVERLQSAALGVKQAGDLLNALKAGTKATYDEIAAVTLRNKLQLEGLSPERVQAELNKVQIEKDTAAQLKNINELLRIQLDRRDALAAQIATAAPAAKAKLEKDLADALALIKTLQDQIAALPKATTERVNAEDAQAAALTPSTEPRDIVKNRINELKKEISELTNIGNIAVKVADGIGNAFAQAFQGLISGSMSAREALGSFFKSVADMFLEMAAQIIAKQMTMIILQTILKALGAIAGGTATSANPEAYAVGTGATIDFAANGASFANGIATFANGGAFTNSIVSSPTLFKFADGGMTRMGLMGEAGPEAIMPLKRGPGGRLGVDASGMTAPYQRSGAAPPEPEVPYQRGGPAPAVPYLKSAGNAPGGSMDTPIEVKFETVRIGGVDYVTRKEAEQIGRESAQRGADIAHKRYRNSPSARRAAGFS